MIRRKSPDAQQKLPARPKGAKLWDTRRVWILIVLLSLCLTACGKEKEAGMQLKKAELTEEESQILLLFNLNQDAAIYDFTADDTVRSLAFTNYQLGQDGNWTPIGGGSFAVEGKKGRIAFHFQTIEAFTIAVQDANGTSSSTTRPEHPMETDNRGSATSYANQNQIEYGKEIPLAIQVLSQEERVESYNVEYFSKPQEIRKLGNEYVYAVTVRFENQPLQ